MKAPKLILLKAGWEKAMFNVQTRVRQAGGAMLLLPFMAGLGSSCTDATTEPLRPLSTGHATPEQSRYFRTPRVVWTVDDEMARIAREEVPGFAGYGVKDGRLTMFLTDVRSHARAVAVLESTFGRQRFPAGQKPGFDRMDVAQAKYDYNQLQTWRLALREPLFRDKGFVTLDIDETQNRIEIGVIDLSARGRLTGILDRLQIPRDAVTTQVTPITCSLSTACPPPPDSTGTSPDPVATSPVTDMSAFASGRLDGDAGTIVAGYEVYHDPDPVAHTKKVCTLGVNARVAFSNGTLDGFFTNSHCTSTLFGSDGTQFFQGNQYAGYEGWDRGTFSYPGNTACAPGYVCRYSDAAFVKYDLGAFWQRGYIAKTLLPSSYGNPNLAVSGQYRIVWYYSPPVAQPYIGQQLVKVGRTTGTTVGQVTGTCRDITVYSPYTYHLLCQYVVGNAWADGGDSGSPVFSISSGNDVWFYGLLWGQPGNTQTSYYFSGWYELVWGDMGTYPQYVVITPN